MKTRVRIRHRLIRHVHLPCDWLSFAVSFTFICRVIDLPNNFFCKKKQISGRWGTFWLWSRWRWKLQSAHATTNWESQALYREASQLWWCDKQCHRFAIDVTFSWHFASATLNLQQSRRFCVWAWINWVRSTCSLFDVAAWGLLYVGYHVSSLIRRGPIFNFHFRL